MNAGKRGARGQFLIWHDGLLRPTGLHSALLVAFNESGQLLIDLQQIVGGMRPYLWENGKILDFGGPTITGAGATRPEHMTDLHQWALRVSGLAVFPGVSGRALSQQPHRAGRS